MSRCRFAAVSDPDHDRPDLGAMVVRLGRALIAAERPALAAHGVSMWGYAVLSALADEPMRTQAALARAIGADKTRIIGTLDELRRPDDSCTPPSKPTSAPPKSGC
jgi:hypothetical protein